MSIASAYSVQLSAGKSPANMPFFRRDGWPGLAERGHVPHPGAYLWILWRESLIDAGVYRQVYRHRV